VRRKSIDVRTNALEAITGSVLRIYIYYGRRRTDNVLNTLVLTGHWRYFHATRFFSREAGEDLKNLFTRNNERFSSTKSKSSYNDSVAVTETPNLYRDFDMPRRIRCNHTGRRGTGPEVRPLGRTVSVELFCSRVAEIWKRFLAGGTFRRVPTGRRPPTVGTRVQRGPRRTTAEIMLFYERGEQNNSVRTWCVTCTEITRTKPTVRPRSRRRRILFTKGKSKSFFVTDDILHNRVISDALDQLVC